MAESMCTPDPHTLMWFFPNLLPQSLKHTVVSDVFTWCSIQTPFSGNLFRPDNAPVYGQLHEDMVRSFLEWKNSSGLHKALNSTPLNPKNNKS